MTTTDHAAGLNGAVADTLRGMQNEAGLRQADLADLSGIPIVSVQRYLGRTRAIDVEALERLAGALGVTAMDVMVRASELMTRRAAD